RIPCDAPSLPGRKLGRRCVGHLLARARCASDAVSTEAGCECPWSHHNIPFRAKTRPRSEKGRNPAVLGAPVRTDSVTDWGSTGIHSLATDRTAWPTGEWGPTGSCQLDLRQRSEGQMKKLVLVVAVAMLSVSFYAGKAAAQGPQGAGAASASSGSSGGSHSLNPIKWVKKDPKSASDRLDAKDEQDKKLTASLQAQGVLAANTDAKSACDTFKALDECVAALHAS